MIEPTEGDAPFCSDEKIFYFLSKAPFFSRTHQQGVRIAKT
jgi:hypothetical protein